MTFDLGGYTPDFIKSMQDMQKQMAAQPAGADNSAQGMAMLGLMQQLTFNRASIRFDDDSLTKQGAGLSSRKQQGQKPEDIANQAKAIVPFLHGAAQQCRADRSRSPSAVDQISRRSEEHRDLGRAAEPRCRSR